jgi:cobalamin biosynthesis protein CobD/CbiB
MRTAAAVAMMLIATGLYAQDAGRPYFGSVSRYEGMDAIRAGQAYAAAMASGNPGVVESALAHTLMMTLAGPAADTRRLRETVGTVARTAGSRELRYKAYLTGMALDKPELFREMRLEGYRTADELFGAVASRLAVHYAAK